MTPIKRITSAFDKKWASYALAGGASLLAPMAANAGLIITDRDLNLFTDTEGATDELFLDIDDNGTDDYRFFATVEGGTGFRSTGVEGINGNLIYGQDEFGFPIARAFLTQDITPGSTLGNGFFRLDKEGKDIKGEPKLKQKGEWPNDLTDTRFLGIIFSGTGGATYQGWVELSQELGSAAVFIDQSAYDDGLSAVPEPSSMALLLLGAAGVAVLKRRNRV